MLKPFDLLSDDISYTGGLAAVTFAKKPRCRAAIVGISYEGAHPVYALRNLVTSFKVAGRNYAQGDAFPLGLIAPTPMPLFDELSGGTPAATIPAMTNTTALTHAVGTADATVDDVGGAFNQTTLNNNFKEVTTQLALQRTLNIALRSAIATLAQDAGKQTVYFPGTLIELDDGRKVGGIAINPEEKITMQLQDLTTSNAPITKIILHCVEFPKEGARGQAAQALWARMKQGEGELVFFGTSNTYTAAFQSRFEQTPAPQHGKLQRRLRVRGALYDGNAVVVESEFRALTAELATQSQPHPAEAVPARHAIGHTGLDWAFGQVDMHQDEKAIVKINAATPAASRTLRLVSIFEGRSPQDEFKGAANGV